MMVFNNEITIRRGESFTMDKTIVNRDGSPYIVSGRMKNPFFLVTVTNSLYDQPDRYVCNVWIPVEIGFDSTVPIDLKSFKGMEGNTLYNSFEELDGLPQGYIGDVSIQCQEGDALFYVEDIEGNRIYRYWKDGDGWLPYECRIICEFQSNLTKDWIEGTYFYNIWLIDGEIDDNALQGQRPIPSQNINHSIPILGSSKLTVLSNYRGGI